MLNQKNFKLETFLVAEALEVSLAMFVGLNEKKLDSAPEKSTLLSVVSVVLEIRLHLQLPMTHLLNLSLDDLSQ